MRKTVRVLNLKTGQEYFYQLPTDQAVKAAYLQFEKQNFNTWEYNDIDVPIEYGKYTVVCGDYAAWRDN